MYYNLRTCKEASLGQEAAWKPAVGQDGVCGHVAREEGGGRQAFQRGQMMQPGLDLASIDAASKLENDAWSLGAVMVGAIHLSVNGLIQTYVHHVHHEWMGVRTNTRMKAQDRKGRGGKGDGGCACQALLLGCWLLLSCRQYGAALPGAAASLCKSREAPQDGHARFRHVGLAAALPRPAQAASLHRAVCHGRRPQRHARVVGVGP
mmetsp:Transcript_42169/g.126294  ORF Transcript_42169/g.126294 Transcript_42169/m.126294 type:complete len:206 (+) Transcript_42169:384-1001(+)